MFSSAGPGTTACTISSPQDQKLFGLDAAASDSHPEARSISTYSPGGAQWSDLEAMLHRHISAIVICSDPAIHIARRLAVGVSPESAVSNWIEDTQRILRLHETYREHLTLVSETHVLSGCDGFGRFAEAFAQDRTLGSLPDPLLVLIAQRALAEASPNSLIASFKTTLITSSAQDPTEFATAGAAFQSMQNQLADWLEEKSLLQSQLRLVQGQLEGSFRRVIKSEQRYVRSEPNASQAVSSAESKPKRKRRRRPSDERGIYKSARRKIRKRYVRWRLKSDISLVRASAHFDADWYLRQYKDVANWGGDPAEHFVKYGGDLLRDPGPAFCTKTYFETHPSVRESGENPLVHHIRQQQNITDPMVGALRNLAGQWWSTRK